MSRLRYLLAFLVLYGCSHTDSQPLQAHKTRTYRSGNVTIQVEDRVTYILVRDHHSRHFNSMMDVAEVIDPDGNREGVRIYPTADKPKDFLPQTFTEGMAPIMEREVMEEVGLQAIRELNGTRPDITYSSMLEKEFQDIGKGMNKR